MAVWGTLIAPQVRWLWPGGTGRAHAPVTSGLCGETQGLRPTGVFTLVSCSKEWPGFLGSRLRSREADAESHIMGAEGLTVWGAILPLPPGLRCLWDKGPLP